MKQVLMRPARFIMLPAWLRRVWVYLRALLKEMKVPPEGVGHHLDDELDEFGRVLFAAPGYGTC